MSIAKVLCHTFARAAFVERPPKKWGACKNTKNKNVCWVNVAAGVSRTYDDSLRNKMQKNSAKQAKKILTTQNFLFSISSSYYIKEELFFCNGGDWKLIFLDYFFFLLPPFRPPLSYPPLRPPSSPPPPLAPPPLPAPFWFNPNWRLSARAFCSACCTKKTREYYIILCVCIEYLFFSHRFFVDDNNGRCVHRRFALKMIGVRHKNIMWVVYLLFSRSFCVGKGRRCIWIDVFFLVR